MRIKTLTISGFRGFARSETFNLDGDAVVIAGVNGSGKTSFFDAILWCLTGSVDRLRGEASEVVSKYSPSGEARVELVLRSEDGTDVTVVRRFDGRAHVSFREAAGELSGPAADARVLEVLWPDASFAAEPQAALSRSLTRATYLQQDRVREFVESDSEQERFQVVSELVGVGRVEELQRQLETGRNNWSRATNSLEREVAPLRSQFSALKERISRLGSAGQDNAADQLVRDWAERARKLVPSDEVDRLSRDRSARNLDGVISALQARQLSAERAVALLQRLLAHLDRPVPVPPDVIPLEEAERTADDELRRASELLATAQEAAAQERRRQVEEQDHTESMRALAQLALQHLAEHCPVCEQPIDEGATRSRLTAFLNDIPEEELSTTVVTVHLAASAVESAEQRLAESRAALRSARTAGDAYAAWQQTLSDLAEQATLEVSSDLERQANEKGADLRVSVDLARQLIGEGEHLSVLLARSAEIAQREDLERQAEALSNEVTGREQDLTARLETGEVASGILDRLREVNAEIVAAQLERVAPLLQRIYAQVDPHPSFRAVSFLTRTVRGRGRLWTALDDIGAHVSVDEPSAVLSSSQLNVLAVSTFLALNLGIETLPLQVVALDDPLQSLDTVNLLGLADLLRRVKSTRQVIVSSHDERLATLLARKLRPVSETESAHLIRLTGWTREGPSVSQEAIRPDVPPLRLVASA